MFNSKEEILKSFKNDSELVHMLGKIKKNDRSDTNLPSIYYFYPESWDSLPAISYYEQDNKDDAFADGEAISETIIVVIDIWSKNSVTAIFRRVDYLMKQLGFIRESAADVPDPKYKHKSIRYIADKEVV